MDPAFNASVMVVTGMGATIGLTRRLIQPDCKIEGKGTSDGNFALFWYTATGHLDIGFGGRVVTAGGFQGEFSWRATVSPRRSCSPE